MKTWTIVVLGAVFLAVGPASAHHSFAMFERQKTITIEGTVKEFQWTNPHTWVQVMVKDPATGKEVEWSVEGSSPSLMTRAGYKRTVLKPGDTVMLEIYPLRAGGPGGSLKSAKINGQLVNAPPPGGGN